MSKKFLIEAHHGIGDVIDALPMISSIKENIPDSYIAVLVADIPQKQIIQAANLVDDIFFLNFKKMSILAVIKTLIKLRKTRFDYGLLSPISNKKLGAILLKITGCKIRISECKENSSLPFCDFTIKLPVVENCHRIERNLALTNAIGITAKKRVALKISCANNEEIKQIIEDKEKYIAFSIGGGPLYIKKNLPSSVNIKKWPMEKYLQLAEYLIQLKYKIIILGGESEKNDIYPFLDRIAHNDKIINLVGKTDILQSAALIEKSCLIVTNDTGLMHLADILKVPIVGIFGPTDPQIIGPYFTKGNSISVSKKLDCQYCYNTKRLSSCKTYECLDIAVETVLAAVIKLL